MRVHHLIDDVGPNVQYLIDALLRSRCLLNGGSHPANGRNRPGQHADVQHEFSHMARADLTCNHSPRTCIDGDDDAQAVQQNNQRPEKGIDAHQPHGMVAVFLALTGKKGHKKALPHIGLYHPNAGINLLSNGVQSPQLLLDALAAAIDDAADVINGHRQNRQGQQTVQRQLRADPQHGADDKNKQKQEVDGVHHHRPYVHAHLGNVFGYARHQIAGIAAFVKAGGQALIMGKNVVAQIPLNETRHVDDGLPHPVHEEAHHQRQGNDEQGKEQKGATQFVHQQLLVFKTVEEAVKTQILKHHI